MQAGPALPREDGEAPEARRGTAQESEGGVTPLEFRETVASIDTSRMPWRLRVWADYDHARMRGILGVSIRSPHRDTGVLASFAAATEFSHRRVTNMTRDKLLNHARKMCRAAFLHEFDECFFVDGRQAVDPHSTVKA